MTRSSPRARPPTASTSSPAARSSISRRGPEGKEVKLATLGKGQFFGEVGILAETRRTATVRAVDDVELFGLSWQIFQETLERSDRADRDFAEIAKERIGFCALSAACGRGCVALAGCLTSARARPWPCSVSGCPVTAASRSLRRRPDRGRSRCGLDARGVEE